MEASTYIEEGAGVLQHQLAGVRFILTVIHIDMELISLQEKRRGKERKDKERNREEGMREVSRGEKRDVDLVSALLCF